MSEVGTVVDGEQVSIREVLTPPLVRMLVGVGLNALGGGLALALFVVYLHQVRGIELRTAGLILSYQALLMLVIAPFVGALVDRVGPRPVLLVACLVSGAATIALGFVTTVPQAVAASTAMAVGGAGLWPPQGALLARLAPPEHRQRVFGLQFMMLNLGLGLGGLVASTFIDASRPGTFTAVYVVNGLSFLAYFVAVLSLRHVRGREAPQPHDEGAPVGYLAVISDRRLLVYLGGALLLLTCGYGSIDAGLPVFMTEVVGLPARAIGLVFFLNTALIVGIQVLVLKRIEGRSRTRMLGVTAAIWAVFWVVVAASAGLHPVAAGVVIALGFGLFALGEMVFSPVGPSLINAFAPPHLRGRYNAVAGQVWGVSGALGPAIAGWALGNGFGVVWALGLALGCGLAGVALRLLGRIITPEEDGRPGAATGVAVQVGG